MVGGFNGNYTPAYKGHTQFQTDLPSTSRGVQYLHQQIAPVPQLTLDLFVASQHIRELARAELSKSLVVFIAANTPVANVGRFPGLIRCHCCVSSVRFSTLARRLSISIERAVRSAAVVMLHSCRLWFLGDTGPAHNCASPRVLKGQHSDTATRPTPGTGQRADVKPARPALESASSPAH